MRLSIRLIIYRMKLRTFLTFIRALDALQRDRIDRIYAETFLEVDMHMK